MARLISVIVVVAALLRPSVAFTQQPTKPKHVVIIIADDLGMQLG